MKRMKRIAIVSVVIFASIATFPLGAYAYYGGFANFEIHEKEARNEILVYKSVTGSYNQTARVTDEVYTKLLDTYKIETNCKIMAQIDEINKNFKERISPNQKIRSIAGITLQPE